jgi:hypothetical protein
MIKSQHMLTYVIVLVVLTVLRIIYFLKSQNKRVIYIYLGLLRRMKNLECCFVDFS